MGIAVDHRSYSKYESWEDPELRSRLQKFVVIEPNPKPGHYARIQLQNSSCPFLSDKLCGIQQQLGEEFLPDVCSTYPRVLNRRNEIHERSLDLSCPEAARLVLSDPHPIQLQLVKEPKGATRPTRGFTPSEPHEDDIRSLLLNILQNRSYAVSHRMTLIGHVCGRLGGAFSGGAEDTIPEILNGFNTAIDGGFFQQHLQDGAVPAASQLALIVELLVCRIRLDYTSPRLLAIYREFSQGLGLETGTDFVAGARRYAEADAEWFQPFLQANSHVLEHYLVTYAYKTIFPFGTGSLRQCLGKRTGGESINAQFLLMAAYFGIIRGVLIGLAGHHQSAFGLSHAVGAIQTCSRTLEHCTSYPDAALGLLSSKGIAHPASATLLTQELRLSVESLGIQKENLLGFSPVQA